MEGKGRRKEIERRMKIQEKWRNERRKMKKRERGEELIREKLD